MKKEKQQNHVWWNTTLALKLTPPTAVRWSFVSCLFFFLSYHIFLVWCVWLLFFALTVFSTLFSSYFSFFFSFVVHTNLFFVFVFRTFLKRSAQFVRLFVRLFIAAGLHSIFIQQFCFCAMTCLFLLQNYYYFFKVLYYLCTETHICRAYDSLAVHMENTLCTTQNRWKIVRETETKKKEQTTRRNSSNDHIQEMQWMSGWVRVWDPQTLKSLYWSVHVIVKYITTAIEGVANKKQRWQQQRQRSRLLFRLQTNRTTAKIKVNRSYCCWAGRRQDDEKTSVRAGEWERGS